MNLNSQTFKLSFRREAPELTVRARPKLAELRGSLAGGFGP